jgi:Group 4 capsule polysaccharide lipoprotein gfcB, YjbF
MRSRILLAPLLAVLALGACAPRTAPVDPRTVLTRAQLDRVPAPLLFAQAPVRGLLATLAQTGTNGDVVTWQTGDDLTLSFRSGVLVASRGFGADTMSADVTGTLAALASGATGFYPRLQTSLDGESATTYRAFQCRITDRRFETIVIVDRPQDTLRSEEVCVSPGLAPVTHVYWQDAEGVMWKSRQSIGNAANPVETELLVR